MQKPFSLIYVNIWNNMYFVRDYTKCIHIEKKDKGFKKDSLHILMGSKRVRVHLGMSLNYICLLLLCTLMNVVLLFIFPPFNPHFLFGLLTCHNAMFLFSSHVWCIYLLYCKIWERPKHFDQKQFVCFL